MRIFYKPAKGAAVFITEPKFGLKREQGEGNGIGYAIDRMQTKSVMSITRLLSSCLSPREIVNLRHKSKCLTKSLSHQMFNENW